MLCPGDCLENMSRKCLRCFSTVSASKPDLFFTIHIELSTRHQLSILQKLQDFLLTHTQGAAFMDSEVFPFFKLPGEVRNMIYRHALIARDSVYIRDMYPDQYRTMKRSGRRLRKLYLTARAAHPVEAGLAPYNWDEQSLCQSQRATPGFFKTIYSRDADHNSELTRALLRTNKEVRGETHSMFYQENTFFFYSMSAVMPFLRDQTPESLAKIRSIGFYLAVDRYFERNPVYLHWVRTFREVSCLAGLRLQDLSLKVQSRKYGPSYIGWTTNALDWVNSITRINDLQALHIEFDLDKTIEPCTGKSKQILDAERVNARWLWCWLAPKMLTDHEGAVELAATYLKSDEAARGRDCVFVLNGVQGGKLAWDLREAMSREEPRAMTPGHDKLA